MIKQKSTQEAILTLKNKEKYRIKTQYKLQLQQNRTSKEINKGKQESKQNKMKKGKTGKQTK